MQENSYKIEPEAVKKLRHDLIMSQNEFASLLQVSYAAVSGWENGRRSPNYKSIRKMLEVAKKHDIEFII